MADRKLSAHFRLAEFACHDGTPVPADLVDDYERLALHVLEPLRQRFGRGIVVSGYRPPAYNASVGGARRSVHMGGRGSGIRGVAADVRFATGTPEQWGLIAAKLLAKWYPPGGGLGVYPGRGGWVHVDTRDYRARWVGQG